MARTVARANLVMTIAGVLAVVALALDLTWAAIALGIAYGVYMGAFALNLGSIAAPISADLNRIRERWRPAAPPVSVRDRRIQAGLLALLGFAIAGVALITT